MPVKESIPCAEAVGVSACGVAHMCGQRGSMEDAFCAFAVPHTPFFFLAVLDGHGGRGTADFAASRLLPSIMATREWVEAAASGFSNDGVVLSALRAGFTACDAAAYAALRATSEERSGSTAIAALVSPSRIFVANCGDSRALLVREVGASTIALSMDHKPDAPSERARLAGNAGAASCKGGYFAGLAVSRSLGDFRTKLDHQRAAASAPPPLLPVEQQTVTSEPEVVVVVRGASDAFLVLACDGVWDVVENSGAAAFVRDAHSGGAAPEDVAAALIHDCLERGSNDNMTAIVCKLFSEPPGAGGGLGQ